MEIRSLATHAEYDTCVELQRVTWGEDFRELVTPAMLMVAQKVGGICAGAFDADGSMLGFVYGLTGIRAGVLTHWSHMLAVREDRRDRGVGQALKQFQRERLLELGVTVMMWTFDPLVARNAHLNLNRLGARILEYVPDMYGSMPLGVLDTVIGTDRVIVQWRLSASEGAGDLTADPALPVVTTAGAEDGSTPEFPQEAQVWVEIPADIQTLKRHAPSEARVWRRTVRHAFQHYQDRDYTVVGLARDRRTGRSFYLFRQGDRVDA